MNSDEHKQTGTMDEATKQRLLISATGVNQLFGQVTKFRRGVTYTLHPNSKKEQRITLDQSISRPNLYSNTWFVHPHKEHEIIKREIPTPKTAKQTIIRYKKIRKVEALPTRGKRKEKQERKWLLKRIIIEDPQNQKNNHVSAEAQNVNFRLKNHALQAWYRRYYSDFNHLFDDPSDYIPSQRSTQPFHSRNSQEKQTPSDYNSREKLSYFIPDFHCLGEKSLDDFISKIQPSNLPRASLIIDIAIGVFQETLRLHSLKILHQDLTAGNFLLKKENNTVHAIDFEISTITEKLCDSNKPAGRTPSEYRAPELNKENNIAPRNPATEVYALGTLLKKLFNKTILATNSAIAAEIKQQITILLGQLHAENPNGRPTVLETLTRLKLIRSAILANSNQTEDKQSPLQQLIQLNEASENQQENKVQQYCQQVQPMMVVQDLLIESARFLDLKKLPAFIEKLKENENPIVRRIKEFLKLVHEIKINEINLSINTLEKATQVYLQYAYCAYEMFNTENPQEAQAFLDLVEHKQRLIISANWLQRLDYCGDDEKALAISELSADLNTLAKEIEIPTEPFHSTNYRFHNDLLSHRDMLKSRVNNNEKYLNLARKRGFVETILGNPIFIVIFLFTPLLFRSLIRKNNKKAFTSKYPNTPNPKGQPQPSTGKQEQQLGKQDPPKSKDIENQLSLEYRFFKAGYNSPDKKPPKSFRQAQEPVKIACSLNISSAA